MKLTGRHSLSEANNRKNYGTPAFDNDDAPLMPEGRPMAQEMGRKFQELYGIIPATTPVAVSELRRTRETATEAGFVIVTPYAILNEVREAKVQLTHAELRASILRRENTPAALRVARLILEDPPEEDVMITHGLVIPALCEVLGVLHKFERFVPAFCEIRELPIN